mmetsp:Transcript_42950/g.124867  ORF Transcript_42950/g.124867 Transcript_42950/m.124867 type:complete len:206 (-) Transcript_42950:74-691(-)
MAHQHTQRFCPILDRGLEQDVGTFCIAFIDICSRLEQQPDARDLPAPHGFEKGTVTPIAPRIRSRVRFQQPAEASEVAVEPKRMEHRSFAARVRDIRIATGGEQDSQIVLPLRRSRCAQCRNQRRHATLPSRLVVCPAGQQEPDASQRGRPNGSHQGGLSIRGRERDIGPGFQKNSRRDHVISSNGIQKQCLAFLICCVGIAAFA